MTGYRWPRFAIWVTWSKLSPATQNRWKIEVFKIAITQSIFIIETWELRTVDSKLHVDPEYGLRDVRRKSFRKW